MAAPTPVVRGTPAGIMLQSGFHTVVAISGDLTISFEEMSTTPPGIDGGDSIETTTFWNTIVRTKSPRDLFDTTDCSFTAAYDPAVYDEILAVVNKRRTITVLFYDGSTLAFFGFLKSFIPNEATEDSIPTAEVVIVVTNFDYINNVEAVPVMTSVAGT